MQDNPRYFELFCDTYEDDVWKYMRLLKYKDIKTYITDHNIEFISDLFVRACINNKPIFFLYNEPIFVGVYKKLITVGRVMNKSDNKSRVKDKIRIKDTSINVDDAKVRIIFNIIKKKILIWSVCCILCMNVLIKVQ
jgi:hypothetical protein